MCILRMMRTGCASGNNTLCIWLLPMSKYIMWQVISCLTWICHPRLPMQIIIRIFPCLLNWVDMCLSSRVLCNYLIVCRIVSLASNDPHLFSFVSAIPHDSERVCCHQNKHSLPLVLVSYLNLRRLAYRLLLHEDARTKSGIVQSDCRQVLFEMKEW